MVTRFSQGIVSEQGNLGGRSPGRGKSPHSLSLREEMEGVVQTYEITQSGLQTLQPNLVAGYQYSYTIQTKNPAQIGLLISLSVDATPAMVSLASASSNYNLAAFGIPNTTQLILTLDWLGKNLIPGGGVLIVGRNQPLTIVFTNMSHYNSDIIATATMGIVNLVDLNDVLREFGRAEVT